MKKKISTRKGTYIQWEVSLVLAAALVVIQTPLPHLRSRNLLLLQGLLELRDL